MVGDDQRAFQAVQLLLPGKAGIDDAADPQHKDEKAKGVVDNAAHPADPRRLVAGQQRNRRKDEEREKHPAKTKTREGDPCPDQAPDIIDTLTHGAGTTTPLARRSSPSAPRREAGSAGN